MKCSHTMRVGQTDGSVRCGDCGKQLSPAKRELALPDATLTTHPARDLHAGAAIGMRLPRSRRRLDIMSMLATGHLPWGVEWNPWLTRYGDKWIMCCGHVLQFPEAQAFVTAGLLSPNYAAATPIEAAKADDLVITDAGRTWLQRNWSGPARMPKPAAERHVVRSPADF